MKGIVRLVVSCPDRAGIVAAVSTFLFESGANIVSSNQHSSDPSGGAFFLRMEFTLPDRGRLLTLTEGFGLKVADRFEMTWRIWEADRPKRLAVMVSRYDHCLQELLWRARAGELGAEITMVISNHPDLGDEVEQAGLPFRYVPVEKGGKGEAEEEALRLLAGQCDAIVLARYMQILSGTFLDRVGVPVINIHHSFLPAFAGAGPYERAKERGVKLVGATAHYVTEELDAGPIIEQDVTRVYHRDDVAALIERGAEIERSVLARAVRWHCEDRVLAHGSTTVVF